MKGSQPTIPLLDRSLQQTQIPLDLWRDLAMCAIRESKPVREIVIEALRERLQKSPRKRPAQWQTKDEAAS